MQFSMWMIAARLEDCDLQVAITEGAMDIAGLRLFTAQTDMSDRGIAFVGDASQIIADAKYAEGTMIVHGHDMIVVKDRDVDAVLNDVLSLFDALNAWETAMWEASDGEDPFQCIAESTVGIFTGSLLLTDRYGFIVGRSTGFEPTMGLWGRKGAHEPDPEIATAWHEVLLDSDILPERYLYQPCIDEEGIQHDDWAVEPLLFHDDTGVRFIGAQLYDGDEPVLWMGEMEYAKAFGKADLQLVQVMERVLRAVIRSSRDDLALPGSVALLGTLESGHDDSGRFEKVLGQMRVEYPLQVIALRNLSGPMENRKTALAHTLDKADIPLVSAVYRTETVVVLSAAQVNGFLKYVSTLMIAPYHALGVSMPFYRADDLATRYRQAVFAIESAQEAPGVHGVGEHAYDYLRSLLDEGEDVLGIHHPVLDQLRDLDARNGSDLYTSLFCYLACERNESRSAEAMHMHRNTFIGRLRRLKSVIPDVDLDDFDTRSFIMLSYLGSGMRLER